jgi:intracellular sulfur oxidation DsrE/DsrF family protein
MKKSFCFLLLILGSHFLHSQTKLPIKNFGTIYLSQNDTLMLDKEKVHRVIFDISTTARQRGNINPQLETIARFINLHAAKGVPIENLEVVAVIHGSATKDGLKNSFYKKAVGEENPNLKILKALKDFGVDFYLCAQSIKGYGFEEEQYSKYIDISPSAMTALIYFQERGYILIDFN